MQKEELTPVEMSNNIEEKLIEEIIPLSKKKDNVELSIVSYLFKQLGINDDQLSEDRKELILRNFIHLICQVLDDMNTIEDRLAEYKAEYAMLEKVKTNEAEYRRRKLKYFVELNEKAQKDIITFFINDIAEYLIDVDYDTLQREINSDGWGMMYINRRYLFAQVSEYYDVDFDYSTVVKISQLPNINWIDGPAIEKKYIEMRKNNKEQYFAEIKKLINQNNVLENMKRVIELNYHLHMRCEIFTDLARLYEEKHYQSFVALGLLQLEGLFYDICSIRYEDKENSGSLVEKAEKALSGKNEISYMRYYPYFAFDVPIKRNEIAHTGLIKSQKLEQLANELLLDLNAVVNMASMESNGKFRVFIIINEALLKDDFSNAGEKNGTLVRELFANRIIAPDSFWDMLKSPKQFEDELEFYKRDDITEGYSDIPTIVRNISDMVYQLPFWHEMVNILKDKTRNDDMNKFLLKMAKNYVNVLDKDSKNMCIEILKALK